MIDNLKTTPLTAVHKALGAKMAPFAGYEMPISYDGIQEEHHCVRKGVGMFDVSHMGEFIIQGPGAFDLVQKVTSNDVAKLEYWEAQYSCLPNLEGGIVDDLIVYRLPDEDGAHKFLLVVNASNIEKDWNWIESNNSFGAKMHDISESTGLLAIQGPKAVEILQKLTEIDLSEIKYYTFRKGSFAQEENILISATGYTGSGGFELYAKNTQLVALWTAVMEAGKEHGIKPIGLGARDTLRLEMGYCLYGNDIDDATSPIEAGLGWITKTKTTDFNSVEIFRQQRADGISRKLVGFTLSDRRVPRKGYTILDADDHEIGIVTSGTQSPSLSIPIGMGYVQKAYSKAGTALFIAVGSKKLAAEVVKLPFYKVE